jgi:glycosyltransferase involved in cell wall biosynthesis
MPYALYLTAAYAVVTSILWVLGFGYILTQLFTVPRISDVDAPAPSSFPSLSVLVPARNEADAIEPALRSLLAQDYPNLEVIAIDDRSTDETGAIMDRLSDEYDHLRVLHIETLPEGWLGKTHALREGYVQATGDWVLMTDADVCYEPGALRSVMAVALHDDLDQISCLPHMHNSGILHEVAYNGWVTVVMGALDQRGVRDPASNDYAAFGAFNMVRRDVFDQTEGFSWLRMDIADDMATAKMMKSHGARQGFYFALDELKLAWYASLPDMIDGLEKNGIAVLAHYNYLRGFAFPFIWGLLFLGPIVGLFVPWMPVQAVSLSAAGLSIPFNVASALRLRRPISTYLFSFFGVWCMMYALFRSTYACARRGGVEWRGTVYPVDQLRKYQRAKF